MNCINRVTLLGNVGSKPTERFTAKKEKYATLSLATSYFNKTQNTDVTEWHNITCFGKTAENVLKYVKKGTRLYVEGKLSTYKKKDYEKDVYKTIVVVDRVIFLDSGQKKFEDELDDPFDIPYNEF